MNLIMQWHLTGLQLESWRHNKLGLLNSNQFYINLTKNGKFFCDSGYESKRCNSGRFSINQVPKNKYLSHSTFKQINMYTVEWSNATFVGVAMEIAA